MRWRVIPPKFFQWQRSRQLANGIIVINAGSTSLKFAAYGNSESDTLTELCRGQIAGMQTDPHFVATGHDGKLLDRHKWGLGRTIDHQTALSFTIDWLERHVEGLKVAAAGHRIVLGGTRYEAPALIEGDMLDYLDGLSLMEPSHQPANVAGARAFATAFGHLPQVACFDSSFHRTMPDVAQTYALPAEVLAHGVRHWGYHGISYEYISREVKKYIPAARRVVAAHLGGGDSMCAMLDGKSIDTTMGFSGLSGLPMATRSGDLPPEIVFYLLRSKAYDTDELERLLYDKSGLLGLSGISSDMQMLLGDEAAGAVHAVEYFVYQVVKYAGAYAAALGGLDAFVFTAGIGEHAAAFRKMVSERLGWLGVVLDEAANARHGPRISADRSKVEMWVIPTDEELMIAQHTLAITRARGLLR
jgi:acetate kinase